MIRERMKMKLVMNQLPTYGAKIKGHDGDRMIFFF